MRSPISSSLNVLYNKTHSRLLEKFQLKLVAKWLLLKRRFSQTFLSKDLLIFLAFTSIANFSQS